MEKEEVTEWPLACGLRLTGINTSDRRVVMRPRGNKATYIASIQLCNVASQQAVDYRLKTAKAIHGLRATSGAGVLSHQETATIRIEYTPPSDDKCKTDNAHGDHHGKDNEIALHIKFTTMTPTGEVTQHETFPFICLVPPPKSEQMAKTTAGTTTAAITCQTEKTSGLSAAEIDRLIARTTSHVFLEMATIALQQQQSIDLNSSAVELIHTGIGHKSTTDVITELVWRELSGGEHNSKVHPQSLGNSAAKRYWQLSTTSMPV